MDYAWAIRNQTEQIESCLVWKGDWLRPLFFTSPISPRPILSRQDSVNDHRVKARSNDDYGGVSRSLLTAKAKESISVT